MGIIIYISYNFCPDFCFSQEQSFCPHATPLAWCLYAIYSVLAKSPARRPGATKNLCRATKISWLMSRRATTLLCFDCFKFCVINLLLFRHRVLIKLSQKMICQNESEQNIDNKLSEDSDLPFCMMSEYWFDISVKLSRILILDCEFLARSINKGPHGTKNFKFKYFNSLFKYFEHQHRVSILYDILTLWHQSTMSMTVAVATC
jgi:hypothetical protein